MPGKNDVTAWGAPYFDSGWIPNSDWTTRHLGTGAAKNADAECEHNLNAPLAHLHVRILVSTSANRSDAGAIEVYNCALRDNAVGPESSGLTISQISLNEVRLQTGDQGMGRVNDAGSFDFIDNEDWAYRIIIVRMI